MKKSILIFCTVLATLSVTAFGFISWNSPVTDSVESSRSKIMTVDKSSIEYVNKVTRPDFVYNIDSRYMSTITKDDLDKVSSITDFLRKKEVESIVSYDKVSVTFLDDNYESISSESGESEILNVAQVKLLQSATYSTNILIRAEYKKKNEATGELQYGYSTPHITVVPEKEAIYVSGNDGLIEYLKENSIKQTTIVKEDKLQGGKVCFTVSKKGTISSIKLLSTSGYTSIDKTMIELITNAPGKWEPATNSKGKKVEQELVFSFGTMGC